MYRQLSKRTPKSYRSWFLERDIRLFLFTASDSDSCFVVLGSVAKRKYQDVFGEPSNAVKLG